MHTALSPLVTRHYERHMSAETHKPLHHGKVAVCKRGLLVLYSLNVLNASLIFLNASLIILNASLIFLNALRLKIALYSQSRLHTA